MPSQPSSWFYSLNQVLPAYLFAPAVVVAWLLILWLFKKILFRRFKVWASRTTAVWDDILIDALSFPLNLIILASGMALLMELLPLPEKASQLARIALQGAVVLAVVLFLDRLVRGYMTRHSTPVFGSVSQGVAKGLVRGFIIGLGALIFLDLMGISITPILASLGIGSLAVALALQDTLSNFFAGIYVTIDKPVAIGDFVKLEAGQQGYVTDVGWRSTRIREPSNNMIVIPNAKLVSSVITNYYAPTKLIAVLVEVSVHYESDLPKVERVVTAVAREIMKATPGGVADFEPFIRFHSFCDSGIGFSVIMQGKEFTDQYLIKHEFIKAVHERFRKEGITIPYPTRTFSISKETTVQIHDALTEPRNAR